MSSTTRPTGVTILSILMLVVSIWWLIMGALYFFGGFYWIFVAGWFGVWAWIYGALMFLLGLIGLGVAGGLQMGVRWARNFTLFLAVIMFLFSIPAWFSGYGIVSAILSLIIIYYLYTPSVKKFFSHD